MESTKTKRCLNNNNNKSKFPLWVIHKWTSLYAVAYEDSQQQRQQQQERIRIQIR
ncbi:hypothetical protein PP707_05705 [Acetobacter pasteurianus]|nr:hypothetical protein [Acetobacter pasteurianus]